MLHPGHLLLRARPRRLPHLRALAGRLGRGEALVVAAADAELLHQAESLVRARLRVSIEGGLPESGFILALSHMGHHELAGVALERAGRRPLEVALGARELEERLPEPSRLGHAARRLTGSSPGVERLDATRWLGGAMRALDEGRAVVWPADAALGSRVYRGSMLGLPWSFPTGAARGAALSGRPLVFGHVLRDAPGRHRLRIGPPWSPPPGRGTRAASAWVTTVMAAFNEDLERVLRARPELYLWRMATMMDFAERAGSVGSPSRGPARGARDR